jgi:predicted amidohydrolase
MRIAIVQGASPAGATDRAVASLRQALAAAAAAGAQLAVFPELYLPGYNVPDPAVGARSADEWDSLLGPLAAETACALAVGLAERDGDVLYNSALVWGAGGERLALYRKTQLFGARERHHFARGERLVTFDLAGVPAALLICYDIEFAPLVAALAARGTRLILCPTANMQPYAHVPAVTVPSQAVNHAVAIAYANQCGSEANLTYTGGSCLVGADGTVLAQAGPGPALLVADFLPTNTARLSTQVADFRSVE